MDPFEGIWFRADGIGVHAMQPGCDYKELRFAWQPDGERRVRFATWQKTRTGTRMRTIGICWSTISRYVELLVRWMSC